MNGQIKNHKGNTMTPSEGNQPPESMTPLELITHLITCLELADGRMDFEEREAWADALSDLFPDHNPQRAVEILQSASQKILDMNSMERMQYASAVCIELKSHYTDEDLASQVYPKIVEIAEADGMVLSSESDMLNAIRSSFGMEAENGKENE